MRAVWWTGPGSPQTLQAGEAPDPVPGAGQVLIEVRFAGITFIETLVRAGRSPSSNLRPPAILGNAVGGPVAAVGEGADPALVGRDVVAGTGGSGGYAQRALAATADVYAVPDGLDLADAVALLADGRTALGLHRNAAPQHGETVLVEEVTGGWARIIAVGQPAPPLDPRGYPGWLPAAHIIREEHGAAATGQQYVVDALVSTLQAKYADNLGVLY